MGQTSSHVTGSPDDKERLNGSASVTLLKEQCRTAHSDFLFSMKKKWIQFWNEPEYVVTIGPSSASSRASKDGLA